MLEKLKQDLERQWQSERQDRYRQNMAISQYWLDRVDSLPALPAALQQHRLEVADAVRAS